MERWRGAAEFPRSDLHSDIEADFGELFEHMKSTFYVSYANYVKANAQHFRNTNLAKYFTRK